MTRASQHPRSGELPSALEVSVVVPVRNEERYLPECLGSLLRQDCGPASYEVLVVDGMSDDATPQIVAELAAQHPNLRSVPNPGRIVSAGRNVGIREARGDVIAFVEGHAFVRPDFVSVIEHHMSDPEITCLGRFVEQYLPGDSPVQQATGLLRKSRAGRNPHSVRFGGAHDELVDPTSCATVYRRAVFERFGLFDESLTTNEDVEFNYRLSRAGVQALHVPELIYSLHPRASVRGFARQMYRYGYGKALFVRRHPRALRLAYALPSLTLLLGVAGAFSPSLRFCLAPICLFVAGAAVSALQGRQRPAWRALRMVLSMTMLVSFGGGFLAGLAGPQHMGVVDAPPARLTTDTLGEQLRAAPAPRGPDGR